MGIEFREGSLVLNSKNQYKLKKGEDTHTHSIVLMIKSWMFIRVLCVCVRHGVEHQFGFC